MNSLCLSSPSSNINHKLIHSLDEVSVSLRQTWDVPKSSSKAEMNLWPGDGWGWEWGWGSEGVELLMRKTGQL